MLRLVPALAVAVALIPITSHADVIDPSEDACGGKNENDACEVGGREGYCKTSTCSKLDYSDGVPPKTKDYDCLTCEPGAAPEPDPKPEDGKDGSGTPAAGDDAKTKPTGSPTPSEAATNAEKKGCSVGATGTSMASVAFGLLLLGWARRRQK
jgi:MYXO-CTERM domain-containing protein